MIYIFFDPFGDDLLSTESTLTHLDTAEDSAAQGNDVIYVYCNGKDNMDCCYNMTGCKSLCAICNMYKKRLLKLLSKNIKLISISELLDGTQLDFPQFEYSSVEEIKNITYKNIRIGYAAFSTYLSISRNLNPLINDSFKCYFNKLLKQGVIYTEVAVAALKKYNPDRVYVFNSRVINARPIVDTCKHQNIAFTCMEIAYSQNNALRKDIYENAIVHDLRNYAELVKQYWNSDYISQEQKISIAENFYNKRKNAVYMGEQVFVEEQEIGKLPDNWETSKNNIVIFNSSEDELDSLCEEYEKDKLFKSQYEGIKYLLENLSSNDMHLYLRIHPNLKNVNYSYHLKLYEFEKLENVTIIPPDSPISTYALIDAAYKIIVFGSTTGIESVYWNKPTILLAPALYQFIDACYFPVTTRELDALVLSNIPPKDKMKALQYAYFQRNDEHAVFLYYKFEFKYFNLFHRKFKLAEIYNYKVPIMRYFMMMLQVFGKYIYYSKLDFPKKEKLTKLDT